MPDTRLKLLDTAPIPGEGGGLSLYQQGDDFVIRIVDGQDLMSTRAHASEDALAEIACAEVAHLEHPQVLIGGLGMGFTLASALRHLGDDAEVVVAELVPAVVEWNRGPLGEKAGHPLRDERVTVHEVDVSIILKAQPKSFDAILLDVDNGPDGLMREGNQWLYSREGLNTCYEALRSKGVLAVWSAGPDHAFSKRLRKTAIEVEEVPVRAHRGKGTRHLIWIARTPER
jgi:spermidine synthase